MSDIPARDSRACECLLVRSDGSRWTVESLELTHDRFRVTAHPRDGAAEGERLESEPLTAEDELRWMDEQGNEVARIRGAEA